MDKVTRPKASKGKINTQDQFELCYLRHQYVRRAEYNPNAEDVAPYFGVVKNLTKHTFWKYFYLFNAVGLESEDITNIGMVHLTSYLSLFSIEQDDNKYNAFVKAFQHKYATNEEPDDLAILNKNRANFSIFLKQRMEDLVRVCNQKGKNIRGVSLEEYQAYVGQEPPPAMFSVILEKPENFGFEKIDWNTFKTLRKLVGKPQALAFRHEELWYVAIALEKKHLNLEDLSGADQSPRDNIHNMNPEELLLDTQDRLYWDRKMETFENKPKASRKLILKRFIEKNKDNPAYAEELTTARKMLRSGQL